jgi:hypothetical protein
LDTLRADGDRRAVISMISGWPLQACRDVTAAISRCGKWRRELARGNASVPDRAPQPTLQANAGDKAAKPASIFSVTIRRAAGLIAAVFALVTIVLYRFKFF